MACVPCREAIGQPEPFARRLGFWKILVLLYIHAVWRQQQEISFPGQLISLADFSQQMIGIHYQAASPRGRQKAAQQPGPHCAARQVMQLKDCWDAAPGSQARSL